MKKIFALSALILAFTICAPAQTSNTFNALQFQGGDVGTRVTAAQAACNPAAAYPCVIVIDPALANFATGTMPTRCAKCVWMDYRSLGRVNISSLGLSIPASVTGYGAVCDGVTDDAAAFQAAANANPDGSISLPAGTCAIGSAISVTAGLNVMCPIRGTTIIKMLSTTAIGFNVQTQSGFQMSNCQLVSATKQTAGAAIQISGPSGSPSTNNSGTNINNIYCSFQWTCISLVKADTYRLHDVTAVGEQFAGIQVDSQANGDSGDSFITNCIFARDAAAPGNTYGIRWITGSTIIANNKFFHMTYGVRVEFASTASTGQLLIFGNRFEPQDQETVGFSRQAGQTANLGAIMVRDNYFRSDGTEVSATPAQVKVNAPPDGSSPWIANIYVGGNSFNVGTKATAINFASGADGNDSLIGENLIIGSAGTSQGVVMAAAVTGVQVRAQHLVSVTTPYTLSTVTPGVFFPDKAAFGVTSLGAALTEQISMPNNKYLAARNAASSAWKQLIGLNASDKVALDPTGIGLVAGSSSISVGLVTGTQSFQGNASGTCTPSVSIIPFMFGGTVLTCTDVTGNGRGVVMTSAGTILNMRVMSRVAGVNASSGVVTILKNGAGQTVTCTIGTGTSCSDTTHSFAVVAGDRLTVVVTTQAAETLADLTIAFEKQ